MKCSNLVLTLMVALSVLAMSQVSGQVTTACTTSLINSFTPCLNFLTGSTNGGGTPTSDCCKALGLLVSSSTDCACLIVTGNVPLSLPINRTLAISLPRLCKSQSVPLQCHATAMPLPGPGPVAYAPTLPPLPPARSDPTTTPLAPSVGSPTADDGPVNQGQRPLVLPNSAMKISHMNSPSLLLIIAFGVFLLNKSLEPLY